MSFHKLKCGQQALLCIERLGIIRHKQHEKADDNKEQHTHVWHCFFICMMMHSSYIELCINDTPARKNVKLVKQEKWCNCKTADTQTTNRKLSTNTTQKYVTQFFLSLVHTSFHHLTTAMWMYHHLCSWICQQSSAA
jgi:hypothetical protein